MVLKLSLKLYGKVSVLLGRLNISPTAITDRYKRVQILKIAKLTFFIIVKKGFKWIRVFQVRGFDGTGVFNQNLD